MTKLESFHNAKRLVDALEAHIAKSKDRRCDKFGCTVKISDSYEGYYGNSSCSRWPDAVVKAIEQQAALRHADLAAYALVEAKRAMAQAAREAKQEAEAVLAAVEG